MAANVTQCYSVKTGKVTAIVHNDDKNDEDEEFGFFSASSSSSSFSMLEPQRYEISGLDGKNRIISDFL